MIRPYQNPDVIDRIINIEEEVEKENESENPDKKKIAKLRMQQIYKGFEMNTGIVRTTGVRPY